MNKLKDTNTILPGEGIYQITETSPSKNFHRLFKKFRFCEDLKVGNRAIWWYLDDEGKDLTKDLKYGRLTSSIIMGLKISADRKVIVIDTMNSIYKIERIE